MRFEKKTLRLIVLVIAALIASSRAAPVAAQEQVRVPSLAQQVSTCFDLHDYARAVQIIEAHLKYAPRDAGMLYNLACAKCRLKDLDGAAAALQRAFKAGFRNIEHMRRDPDLSALRDDPTYKAIMEQADRVAAEAARPAVDRWRNTYGTEHYRYETDDKRRINYATALDETSHREMRQMLERQADQLRATLFPQPPNYFILIAVPTPEDSDKYFNGRDDIGGMYVHNQRQLVARDIGASLRHEFVHALHFGDMERLGQPHPLWIQEGLAALYEDYELKENDGIAFLPNERALIIRNRVHSGRAVAWSTMMAMTGEQFMARSQSLYPQVRSVFMYLVDRGVLVKWYQTYIQHFDDDRSGATALEIVLGKPIDEIERDWRRWVLRQPTLDLQIRPDDAALGIRCNENGSNDGVLINYIVPGSAAARSDLRKGDVIVAVDGGSARTLIELRKIIASKSVGDEVQVKARRNGAYFTARVVLRPA